MFTKSELEIMTLLWGENRPLTRNEIIELTPNKSWKPTTIHVLLNSLLAKKAIEVSGISKSGVHHYSRTFVATMTQEEYAASYMDTVLPNPNFAGIISAFAGKRGVNDEALDELSAIIEELRNKQKEN